MPPDDLSRFFAHSDAGSPTVEPRSQLPAGLWIYNAKTQTLHWDPGMHQIYGVENSFSGRVEDWKAFIHPDDISEVDAAFGRIATGNASVQVRYRIVRADGRERKIAGTGTKMLTLGGAETLILGVNVDVTDQEVAEENLRWSLDELATERRRLEEIVWATDVGTWEWNLQTGATVFNDKWAEIVGYKLSELQPVNISTWLSLCHPEDAQKSNTLLQKVFARESSFYEIEARMRHKDGDWVWVLDRGKVLEWTAEGLPLRMSGTHVDITRRVKLEIELETQRRQLELAATVFDVAREGILIVDRDTRIIAANQAVTEITGFNLEELIGQNPRVLASGVQKQDFYENMWGSLLRDDHWEGEVWNRHKSGRLYAELLKIAAVRDEAGGLTNYVALFSDITRQKEHENELKRIAHYDALTGLANRVLLADRLQMAIGQGLRRKASVAVVYLDLDGFKDINDIHGHAAGDQLLITVAHRMKSTLRDGDTLARIGGDEFVAVLSDLADRAACEQALQRLLAAASDAVTIGDQTMNVTASIGVTLCPEDGLEADGLMRQADQAMYVAKQSGKNRVHFFDSSQESAGRQRQEAQRGIQRALARGEFVLYYQPKVDMREGRVVGAEALIRWQHPEKGLLAPSAFLPFITGHGLEVEIGQWVIETALSQMAAWRAVGFDIPVSVNISASQMEQGFLSDLIRRLAAHPTMMPGALELELLESSALDNLSVVSDLIAACKQIGVRFALDDFGTGYSSLTYLRHLPVATLKIDQSFVRDMLKDSNDLAIVEGVLGLARAFHCDSVAEGVETAELGAQLVALGCRYGQGYGFARPMPADDLPAWAADWNRRGGTATPDVANS